VCKETRAPQYKFKFYNAFLRRTQDAKYIYICIYYVRVYGFHVRKFQNANTKVNLLEAESERENLRERQRE